MINPHYENKNLNEFKLNNLNPPRNLDVANRAIWKIFSKCHPVEGNEEIVITGQVLADGRGDWAAMRKQQKYLRKMFPDRTVRIIASSAMKWEGQLGISKKDSEPADLIYYGNAHYCGIEVPLSAFPPEVKVIEKVEQAGVVIEGGVSIGELFPKEVIEKIKENSIKIHEHDFTTSSNSISSTILKTGVHPSKDGIFLTSNKKEYKWQDLSNTKLKSVLFEDNNPKKNKVDEYLSKNVCFFCYMSEPESNFAFIAEAACFADANSPEKSIDICLPNIVKDKKVGFSKSMIKEIEYLRLQHQGIDRVKVIWFDGDKQLERTISLGEDQNKGEGKELRLIDPGGLSAKDFKIMVSVSGPLVGCTGDNSLAETLSMGKIPCYEPRFTSKVNALLTQISDSIGYKSALYQYCEYRQGKHRISRVGAALPGLAEQAKQLGEIIREKSSFKPVLKGVVNEKLLRQKDKDFAEREDTIRQNYLDYKISIEQLETQLTALLSEKGMLPE